MAVDLMAYSKMDDQIAIQEATSAGLKNMEHLISLLSHQTHIQNPLAFSDITDSTVSKFKKVISILNRTGHARFRRGSTSPVQIVSQTPQTHTLTLDFSKPIPSPSRAGEMASSLLATKESFSISPPISTATNSSFLSSVTGDGSVSNGKQGSSILLASAPAPAFSAGKPPLSSSHRRKCHGHSDDVSGKSGSSRCHCSKRRKSRVKNTIRIPAISSKVADIPTDEYSWRKYGQKPIKGSPYPRGYYKCSSVRGCPARKHVERDPEDPTMLIVTYEAEHRHSQNPLPVATLGLVLESS